MQDTQKAHAITFDGPPVTRDLTLDKLEKYLRATGWAPGEVPADKLTIWERHSGFDGGVSARAGAVIAIAPAETAWRLKATVETLARVERRHPSAVLRDIAKIDEPAAPEPDRIRELEQAILAYWKQRIPEPAVAKVAPSDLCALAQELGTVAECVAVGPGESGTGESDMTDLLDMLVHLWILRRAPVDDSGDTRAC